MKKITLEAVTEFMEMLTGERLPEGMTMTDQPKMSVQSAFSVVWYLQEHLRIIPDNYQLCVTCGELYDSHCDGHTIDSDDSYDFWREDDDITPEVVKKYDGVHVCSVECEYELLTRGSDEVQE